MSNTSFAIAEYPTTWPIGQSLNLDQAEWIEQEVEEHRFLTIREQVTQSDYHKFPV